MNNKIEPKVLKGFTDYLPKEAKARQILFRTIEQVFERFGFMPMYTPALEYKEILLNKYGDDEKLVYSFTDNGGREVALRYDLTVPLARFVALHQNEITIPFKRYQIAPVWRAENTQRGRLREFYQCDVDIVGSETVLSDAEIIACLCFVLDEIGVTNYQARINDRGIFNVISDVLKLSLEDNVHMLRSIDKYYKIGVDGVITELEKYNFSKERLEFVKKFLGVGVNKEAIENLKQLLPQHPNIADHISELFKLLEDLGVDKSKLLFDPLIARGLDYYTGMVFEISLVGETVGSIAGGGRYNSLLDQFSKNPLPAVGGSIGIDRIIEAVGIDAFISAETNPRVLIFNLEPDLFPDYIRIIARLRKSGIATELYIDTAKMEKQFKFGEQKNFTHAIIYGNKEKTEGQVQIKDLATREQRAAAIEDLVRIFKEGNAA